jgi:hypothetical protein
LDIDTNLREELPSSSQILFNDSKALSQQHIIKSLTDEGEWRKVKSVLFSQFNKRESVTCNTAYSSTSSFPYRTFTSITLVAGSLPLADIRQVLDQNTLLRRHVIGLKLSHVTAS